MTNKDSEYRPSGPIPPSNDSQPTANAKPGLRQEVAPHEPLVLGMALDVGKQVLANKQVPLDAISSSVKVIEQTYWQLPDRKSRSAYLNSFTNTALTNEGSEIDIPEDMKNMP